MVSRKLQILPWPLFFPFLVVIAVIPIAIYFGTNSKRAIHPDLTPDPDYIPIGLPSTAGYQWSRTLYQDNTYRYSIFWNITNQGTDNELIDMTTVLTAPSDLSDPNALALAWVGIGWGRSMLEADFTICHMDVEKLKLGNQTLAADVHEHYTQKKYAAPLKWKSPHNITKGLEGGYQNGQFICHWQRKTKSDIAVLNSVNVADTIDMLWAFNPRSGWNYRGETFSYHQENHRGKLRADLTSGNIVQIPTFTLLEKQVHGGGMATIWLIIFPLSIFYARYLRSTYRWIVVHITIQCLGIVAMIAFLALILSNYINMSIPHAVVGFVIFGLIAAQISLGVFNALGLMIEKYDRIRKYIQRFHYLIGATLMLLCAAQVGLGLDILYPWIEPRVPGLWVAYWALLGVWLGAFIFAEIWHQTKMKRKDPGIHQVEVIKANMKPNGPDMKGKNGRVVDVPLDNLTSDNLLSPTTRTFSWASLNQAILDGELLVVGNRRYVYDISQWIKSHPGGQIILYAVAGTDISNDYFHEAGFDASEFTPKKAIPQQKNNRTLDVKNVHRESSIVPKRPRDSAIELFQSQFTQSQLTEEDWKKILRSRRTHVHSRLAIQKLASLLIGELPPPAYELAPSDEFDPQEYRRYTITVKTLLTTNAIRTPVYSLRLCHIYPHTAVGTPPPILPGQSIEVQARIDGEWVSRYYTPVSGDMSAFEIDVKVIPDGLMSKWLAKLKPGDRQLKVRGPFGAPIVGPGRVVPGCGPVRVVHGARDNGIPEEIVFIAAGSGLSPFIQAVKHLLLPIGHPLMIAAEHHPAAEDELPLYPGDFVYPTYHYNDGWALGQVAHTGATGIFPLPVTFPPHYDSTRPFKITLINCVHSLDDVYGGEVFTGAKLAYPDLIDVHHFVEALQPRDVARDDGVEFGTLHAGRLDPGKLMEVLGRHRWGEEAQDGGLATKCMVCGPPSFNMMVMDTLQEAGATAAEVAVLLPDRYVGPEALGA
ncbi:hypothetical protein HDV00_000037 [Rhizophlyctis rosea]|nr:hypothetical protein HDV00_000037 [Rhizophlyctis rosea]